MGINLINTILNNKVIVNKNAKDISTLLGITPKKANRINENISNLVEKEKDDFTSLVKQVIKGDLINTRNELAYGMFVLGNLTEKFTLDRELKNFLIKDLIKSKMKDLKEEGKLDEMIIN